MKKESRMETVGAMDVSILIGCKNRCSYCPQDKITSAYKDPKQVMSLQDFKTCLNKIPKNIRIIFAGMAEPFFNKECMKMIEYTSEQGYVIDIYTTLMGMKLSFVERLETIPIAFFELHLPDDSEKTNMKVDETYLKVLKAVKNSKIPNIHYQLFGKLHPDVQKVLNFDVEDVSRLLRSRAGNLKEFEPINLTGKITCPIAEKILNNNLLLPNGDVLLCSMDYGTEYKIGNLLESSYESLFESQAFKKMVDAINSDSEEILCRHCAYAKSADSLKYKMKRRLEKIGLTRFLYGITKNKAARRMYLWAINKKENKLKIKEF